MADSKENTQLLQVPGTSRWQDIKGIVNCSFGFWKKLTLCGKAPAPRKLSLRMVVYSNEEILAWLSDPSNYDQAAIDAKRNSAKG
jgi:hypothetical protein